MRLFRPGFMAGWLYPDAILRIKTTEKLLCLTFDDGPDQKSTPQIVNMLDKYKIKAVFFCNGRSAEKYPSLIQQLISHGHVIGNHGFSHLNGWKTSRRKYITDITNAAEYTSSVLFRPPYGRLRLIQYLKLRRKYKVVLWDVMPYDFDMSFGYKNTLTVLMKKIRPGSIVVLHDQPSSSALIILDQFIDQSLQRGYKFIIPEELR
jgi:peptidoglycan/xylan/chitin deacetylase (PgdA/CDA1 family)